MLGPMEVTGRDGATIDREWANDDPKAHLGITVPGFPNLFLLVGPGTGLAHGGSIFFVTECQVRYVARMLVEMVERGIDARMARTSCSSLKGSRSCSDPPPRATMITSRSARGTTWP